MAPAPASILIIDDDDADRALCRRTIKHIWGDRAHLTDASDGETGLNLIDTRAFDCLLLDHSLPGINGIEVLKRLRLNYPYLPVIMLDGKGNDVIAVRSMKEGAQDYIAKASITPPVLERAILTAIGNREMAKSVRQSEERYRSVFGTVSEGIFVLNAATGITEDVNSGGAQMLGYIPGELIGMRFDALSSGTPPYTSAQAAECLGCAEPDWQRFDWQFRAKSGRVVVAGVAQRRAAIAGRPCVIAVVRDLTQQRESEAHLRKLQDELAHVARLSVLGEMAAAIAHEVNQPLSAAANYANIALRTLKNAAEGDPADQSARVRDIVEKLANQVARAGKIVKNLRNLAEKRETERIAENLNEVVKEAVALCQAGAIEKNLQVILELDQAVAPVAIDKIQIQQVLTNLIRNSMDAMSAKNKQRLTIATGMDKPGFAQVTVSDTGGGLDEAVLARLFQPFTTTKKTGMGIGLRISQSIIESHGGRIWVLHNDSEGVVFRMTLPLA